MGTAKALGMCRTHVLSVGASCSSFSGESDFTVIVTARDVFSFGGATDEEGEEAEMAQLGHGGHFMGLEEKLMIQQEDQLAEN